MATYLQTGQAFGSLQTLSVLGACPSNGVVVANMGLVSRALDKEICHNPHVPFWLRAPWTHLLRCRHLTMGAIACVPDASHLDPRRS